MTYRSIYIKLGKDGCFTSLLKYFLSSYIIYFLSLALVEQLNDEFAPKSRIF